MNDETGKPLIAVFDVGKTHSKLTLVDPATGRETFSQRRVNAALKTAQGLELDVAGIETWLLDTLRAAPGRERIAVIVPIAHGAAAALVDHSGELLAAPDYEDPRFEQVNAEYRTLRDSYDMSYSPDLPLGLNLGRQLFYLQRNRSALFERAAHILLYPQYWAWRLCGTLASEVTSLGTHTDLWRPHENAYSNLARRQGWSRLLPPMRTAGERLGRVRPGITAATGLDAACEVACGIHDSNASYLRFLIDREHEAFTVVSSGTWTVVMANRGDLRRLREDRDMLANVNAFGAPVATARYMGGREYEAIANGSGTPTSDAVIELLAEGVMALPSFASAGPFAGRTGHLDAAERLTEVQRAALATIYSALMTALLIESLGAAGEIFVDGPLARNPLFARLLAACVPVGTVHIYADGGDTRVAAFLAGMPARAPDVLQTVVPLHAAGLAEYQANWRHKLEQQT